PVYQTAREARTQTQVVLCTLGRPARGSTAELASRPPGEREVLVRPQRAPLTEIDRPTRGRSRPGRRSHERTRPLGGPPRRLRDGLTGEALDRRVGALPRRAAAAGVRHAQTPGLGRDVVAPTQGGCG